MDRRAFLTMMAACATLLGRPAWSVPTPVVPFGPARPFRAQDVAMLARGLAERAYMGPPPIPETWTTIDYDQYRNIRFRPGAALLRGSASPFELQLFAPGFYFRQGVAIALVEDGIARPVRFDRSVFEFGPLVPDLPDDPALTYSGFRVHGAINRADHRDEFAVFQGASYFRAVARGQAYGLSARGLAVDTAEPDGEEFPVFRAFWIEVPGQEAQSIRIHALLDSPSVSGAYRFDITPGAVTVMDVEERLYPRADLAHVGIAPLTSMFLFDETNRSAFDDFRPAVHDSDGLMVFNGAGEQLWRPLANPRQLQISQFLDRDPRGFGLVQRARRLGQFADLEAHYENRPSAWVEPSGDWGAGSVSLVEIPTDREINDNIVAYWRPAEPLAAGGEHAFGYRLSWCWSPPEVKNVARVTNTAMGAKRGGGRIVAIDFAPGPGAMPDLDDVVADMHSRPGSVSPGVVQRNPETGGLRLAFSFDPESAESVELRAQLRDMKMRPLTEVWLYRWTS